MSNPYPDYKRNTITVPARKRPQNCGTSYCSCIECVMEPAQQEPVAKDNSNYRLDPPKLDPLYTPAQRTWVGLTLEDMETTHWSPDFRAGAKWAAAKLKEKNNG